MKKDRRPCSVFSDREVDEIRKVPGMMKWILLIFAAIVILIFVPFQTVSQLAEQVGTLSAIVKERREAELKFRENQAERLSALENKTCLSPKKFYWINRNSREANERIKELKNLLELSRSSAVREKSDKAGVFPPCPENGLPGH